MKRKIADLFNSQIILIALIIFGMLFLQGCKKDDGNPVTDTPEQGITEEQAAEVIAEEIVTSENPAGLSSDCETAAYTAKNGEIPNSAESFKSNSVQFDTTIVLEYNVPPYQYNYSLSIGYSFVRNGKELDFYIPGCDTLEGRLSSEGTYTQPLFSGQRTSDFPDLTLHGIESSESYIIDGNYTWQNTLSYTNNVSAGFSVNGSLAVKNITVEKTNLLIIGGSCEGKISGETDLGMSYEYSASITFNSDQTATIQLKNVTFVVDLNTGDISKQQ